MTGRSAAVEENKFIPGERKRGFFFNITGLSGTKRILLLCPSGGFAMTSRRNSAKLKLRRSFSEQLRSSTSKAWDLLWRNVRERRLAGQYPAAGAPRPADRERVPGGLTSFMCALRVIKVVQHGCV